VIGAAVAQCLYTAKVRGSNPLSPTNNLKIFMSAANPKIIDLSNKDFKDVDGLFLLDFWAPWCGPCIEMEKPLLELVSEDLDEKLSTLRIGKINVDQDSEKSAEFEVRSIPSMFLVKISNGNVEKLGKFVGYMNHEKLKNSILNCL
jgi:thioredoxin 1